ncbi:odorant receptor 42a-like [Musca domestica]|uniref:Odorant receptor n=1 Tax=Musca domestica TaxID=7370 RepID=A0A9J7CY24_MUSDO|nr:odorant receptor 42a-like [Musca domestica]XP_058981032.1 odorant receptor 42a-like [Musca domestica]
MTIKERLRQIYTYFLNIRIFHLAHMDIDAPLPKTRDATVYIFRGLNIIGYVPTETNKLAFYMWSGFVNFFVTVYLPVGFLMSFLLRLNTFSPSDFFTSLQIWINCIGCSLKMFVFFFLHRRLIESRKFMDRLDVRIDNDEDRLVIRKIVAFSNRSLTLYSSLYLSYASSTFLVAVINSKPPYQVFNPFFLWKENVWKFTMQAGFEYMMIAFHCFQQALLDSYPVIFITIIRTHLHILTRRISRLGSISTMTSDERYEALVQCVLDHKNIMGLYSIFCPVISGTMFVQFLIIGLILGITTLHIFLFADRLAIIASLFYVASILAETFPCSFLANCLMDDSDRISLAIFHSAWHEEEPRYKQMICFFLQHTQKTLILTAMKIFPITLNSNINVVKFAFSVYTMMKQMGLGQNLQNVVGKDL